MVTSTKTASNPLLDLYVDTAAAIGMTSDQLQNFVFGGYVAQESQIPFHIAARDADKEDGPELLHLGGTRGSAKTHAVFAQMALDDCQRKKGLKCLFLRKLQKSAGESFEDLVPKILYKTDHEYISGKIKFPNGSRILIGGFKDEKDIDKYIGIEYDLIAAEEITLLSATKQQKIRGSLRTSRTDWRPRLYATWNPEGIGYGHVKKTIVDPWRKKKENYTRFFHMFYQDNAFINQGYRRFLKGLTGDLAKSWEQGDLDVLEGAAFDFDYNIHTVDPFVIPPHFIWLSGLDDGSTNPFCCIWRAYDPIKNRYYIVQELYQAGLTSTQQARLVYQSTPNTWKVQQWLADPAFFTKNHIRKDGEPATSAADIYAANGILLTRADNDRINGKRKIDDLLGLAPDGLPKLQIFRTCTNGIEEMSNLIRDEHRPEDVDTKLPDHFYDALRYVFTGYRSVLDKPDEKKEKRIREFEEAMLML